MGVMRVVVLGVLLWLGSAVVSWTLRADFWWQWPRSYSAAVVLLFLYVVLALCGWGLYAARESWRGKGFVSLINAAFALFAGFLVWAALSGQIAEGVAEEWSIATGKTKPARIAFESATGRITFKGAIERGTAARFAEVLQSAQGATVVALDSPGGLISEADRIGKMLSNRGLDTLIERRCMSACVDIFASGQRRLMWESAVVGLHSAASVFGADDEGVAKDNEAFVKRMHDMGVERRFAQIGADTPSEEMTVSTARQAYVAGLATGVISTKDSASSK